MKETVTRAVCPASTFKSFGGFSKHNTGPAKAQQQKQTEKKLCFDTPSACLHVGVWLSSKTWAWKETLQCGVEDKARRRQKLSGGGDGITLSAIGAARNQSGLLPSRDPPNCSTL